MVNGLLDFIAGARNFRFQQGNARMKLVNGEGVEILPGQGSQRVIGPFGNKVFHIHDREC